MSILIELEKSLYGMRLYASDTTPFCAEAETRNSESISFVDGIVTITGTSKEPCVVI